MKNNWVYNIVLIFLVQSCAYSLHEFHVSDFEKATGTKPNIVEASSEQFVILGIAFDTDYVEIALSQLIQKCPKGTLDGITTKYSTDLGFFSWTNRIKMMGICRT